MTCTRRSIRTGRPCRRDHAEWPDDWPDLPPVVACWTHLSEDERAMYLQARERKAEAGRWRYRAMQEQLEREAEERRAAGIPDPVPVQYTPQPCNNTCTSEQRATDSDSAISRCANCDFYVCITCGTKPAPDLFGECSDCDTAATSYLLGQEEQHAFVTTAPELRGRLNQLVGQIVAANGGDYARVHAQLNRDMGVQRRDQATAHHLQHGVVRALAWLERLTDSEMLSPTAPTSLPLVTQPANTDRQAPLTEAEVTELRRLIIDATAILERLHAFDQRLQITERTTGRA